MKLRAIIAVGLALFAATAQAAQKTKAQLTTTITTNLPSSGTGQITAAILRQVLQDIVDSDQQIMLLNQQTGVSYTFLAADQGKLVTFNNAAPVAVTLPQAIGDFAAGYNVLVQNLGAGAVTITPTLSTINGAATLTLNQNQVALIVSAGLNVYRSITYGLMLSVTCGAGMSGGVITTSGTCDITDTISPNTAVGSATLVPVVTFNSRGQLTAVTTQTISANTLTDTITNQRGTMLFRGTAGWQGVGPCSAGQVPSFGGTGADVSCATVPGTGTVTSIAPGAGMTFSANPITVSGTISADIATNANNWAATANKVVDSAGLNTAGNPVTVTQSISTITLNLASGVDFNITLNTTPVFANPTVTSDQLGRTGCIWITQPTTTYYAVSSFGSNWKFAGGTPPTLTTTSSAVDALCYKARSTSFIWGALSGANVR